MSSLTFLQGYKKVQIWVIRSSHIWEQIFTSFEQHVYNIYEALKNPLFLMIYKNCFVSLYWAFHMKINGQWMHWSSKIYIRSMGPTNIKLSEVHFNTCLLTSSSKPQEFAVGTVFKKCAPKSAVLGRRKIQIVYLIILWRIFQLSNFVRSNSWEILNTKTIFWD